MAIVLTDSKNYEDIADAIREKLGTTETYKPREMPAAIESISGGGGGGSLDYTVTFKDEDGETQAVYTVKSGIGNISKPSGIEANGYKDENGNAIAFPINPTSDLVLTADNSALSEKIYACQGFSQSQYKYVKVGYSGGSIHLCFANNLKSNESATSFYFTSGSKACRDVYGSGATDIKSACEYFTTNKKSFTTDSYDYYREVSAKSINADGITNYSSMDTL